MIDPAPETNIWTEYNLKDALEYFEENYDYKPPSEQPTPSEQHVPLVTPRAFLDDTIGYGLAGSRLPNHIGRILRESVATEPVLILSRFLNPDSELPDRFRQNREGYCGVIEIYRIDGESMGENPFSEFGKNGYLLRYLGGTSQDPATADIHDHIGYYTVPLSARSDESVTHLIHNLVGDGWTHEHWNVAKYVKLGVMMPSELRDTVEQSLVDGVEIETEPWHKPADENENEIETESTDNSAHV